MEKVSKLQIFSDGGARGNPGPAATGWVIYDTEKNKRIEAGGTYLGEATNNEAEFKALLEVLERSEIYEPEQIECFLDSELLVRQLNGLYKVKAPNLKPLIAKILEMSDFRNITFKHVVRDRNKEADAMVNKVLDKNV